jgi:NADH-quinone oxidoreductase subunit M
LRDAERAQRYGAVVTALTLASTLAAWLEFCVQPASEARDPWSLAAGFTNRDLLVIDQLSAPLLPLAALLYLVVAVATLRTKIRRFSFVLALLSESILLATLSCRHPWGIIALLGLGVAPPLWELRTRGRPRRVFAIHMALFVAMLILGWRLIDQTLPGAPPPAWGVALVMGAVLLRCGIAPLHGWIADLFEQAAFGTALLFVTPMVGAYAAVRLLLPIAPDWALRSMGLLSLLTAVYAAALALVQRDARRMFCYLFLSNSSLVLVGLEIASPLGLTGGLSLWLSASMALTGFGLVLRSIEARKGRLQLNQFHGLYEHTPTLAAFFLLTGLASIGFPGTIGFVGVEILVEGAVDANPFVGMAVVLAAAMNGIAVVQAYFRVFTGKRYFATISLQCRPLERVAVLTLAALILLGGMFPQPGLSSRYHAAQEVIKARRHVATAQGFADRAPSNNVQSIAADRQTSHLPH